MHKEKSFVPIIVKLAGMPFTSLFNPSKVIAPFTLPVVPNVPIFHWKKMA